MESEAHALENYIGDYVRRDKKLKGCFGETSGIDLGSNFELTF